MHPSSLLSHVRIVLVQTFHSGNIGSSARAMRTMGVTDLRLVNPRDFPSDQATQMAAGANDVIESAQVHTSLEDAVADCHMVIGASARLRELALPCFEHGGKMAQELMSEAEHGPVALVFGRERSGLTNEELSHCTHQLRFPTDDSYGVLNLSQAVQIACYEVRNAWLAGNSDSGSANIKAKEQRPTAAQLDYFEQLLTQLLTPTGFLNQPHARTEEKLNTIFRRSDMSSNELSMMIGALKALAKGGE
ncbi:RNA methyltransferase [Carnimonas bestiolae]|uniref:RNA methyltransferase n=1 Tax=Carnimonas bestiolae TaxID=3402172 RepID=UPI003F4AAAF5